MWRVSFLAVIIYFGCKSKTDYQVVIASNIFTAADTINIDTLDLGFARLSTYSFFVGAILDLSPAENVYPYGLNATLFSDYAEKERFIYLPEGKKLAYISDDDFKYPDGCVLIKNFYYPSDIGGRQIIETRLLIKEGKKWIPINYVWNSAQTEAYFWPIGHSVNVSSEKVGSNFIYDVPDLNQCKNCHMHNGVTEPIGPSPANWNKIATNESGGFNQMRLFDDRITNLPLLSNIASYVDYNNENETIEARARAYLDINCGSCHRENGSAKTSGLDLEYKHEDLYALGLNKPPVAAGKASGGRLYDIVPGRPDESILLYRMENNDPAVRMPEIGRKIVHEEGVEIIKKWIISL